ncbi:unnamed protein product [Paramecium sonneborni]|uniref:Uncharacterized protein n=1 Tax=Paramecium sonneborni TaxID=65129 RepID=A0A8S1RAS7_9CILI|nr:unnamed protein product [Paramecium sonneborni]
MIILLPLHINSQNFSGNQRYDHKILLTTFRSKCILIQHFHLKHNDIQISDNGKIIEIGEGIWGNCMCKQVIPKTGKIRFAFEMLGIGKECLIGIGFREIVKQKGYIGAGQGKGSYLLFHNSEPYFHHTHNTQGKAFQFKINDIVIIEASVEQSQDLYPYVDLCNSKVRIKDIS